MTARSWRLASARTSVCAAAALALLFSAGCGRNTTPAEVDAPAARAPAAEQDRARAAPAGGGTPAAGLAPVGDPLLALRQAVAAQLGQAVRVDLDERRSSERWMFATGVARTPDGRPVDYAQTPLAARAADGELDDGLCALLENRGDGWQVVALEIGATDVPFVDWPARYGVPASLVMGQ